MALHFPGKIFDVLQQAFPASMIGATGTIAMLVSGLSTRVDYIEQNSIDNKKMQEKLISDQTMHREWLYERMRTLDKDISVTNARLGVVDGKIDIIIIRLREKR